VTRGSPARFTTRHRHMTGRRPRQRWSSHGRHRGYAASITRRPA